MSKVEASVDVTTRLVCGKTKNENEGAVDQCVQLLEHAGECRVQGLCTDEPRCRRACRVLLHHRTCSTNHCSVCRQLEPLCHLHARRCQNKNKSCNIPYCPNRKMPQADLSTRSVPLSGLKIPGLSPDPNECLVSEEKSANIKKSACVESVPRRKNLTFLPQLGLKNHGPVRSWCNDSYRNATGCQREVITQSILSWKAKLSIVPMK